MQVYFDNAATTRPLQDVADRYRQRMLSDYANPASMSCLGMEGEKIIEESKMSLANLIGCDREEIYFTSGGSEGDNWAIFGTAKGYHRSGKHVITTNTEHPAVFMPCHELAEDGFEVTYLDVDEKGYISLEELADSIRPDTILVSIIAINNETGTIQDLEKIGAVIKEKNPAALFHVDGVQAFGKYRLSVKKAKIDMLTASAHKFHGPKGLGFFYMKKGLRVKPLIYGGGHQAGMRAGTENAAGAEVVALAAQKCYENLEEHNEAAAAVKRHLFDGIMSALPDVLLNGEELDAASPYVLNLSFLGLKSEVLLHALEEKNIFVSAGSACNSKKKKQSGVLEAMGLSKDRIEGAVRFSFSRFNTLEEADFCIAALKEIVPVLRRFHRKR